MRLRTMALIATVAALAVAIAAAPASAQDKKKVLKTGWVQDAQTLNPFVAQDEENFRIWALNWDLLVNFSPDDLSPVPGFAKSWKVSKDKKTVTFKLIDGAKWSDGEPITSKDVKYSLEKLGSDSLIFTGYTSNVTSIETPDDADRRDPHQAAGRAHHRRPVHLHDPGARLRQGAALQADKRTTSRPCRWSAAGPGSSPSSSAAGS